MSQEQNFVYGTGLVRGPVVVPDTEAEQPKTVDESTLSLAKSTAASVASVSVKATADSQSRFASAVESLVKAAVGKEPDPIKPAEELESAPEAPEEIDEDASEEFEETEELTPEAKHFIEYESGDEEEIDEEEIEELEESAVCNECGEEPCICEVTEKHDVVEDDEYDDEEEWEEDDEEFPSVIIDEEVFENEGLYPAAMTIAPGDSVYMPLLGKSGYVISVTAGANTMFVVKSGTSEIAVPATEIMPI